MTLQRTMKLYRLPDVSKNVLQVFEAMTLAKAFNVGKSYLQES